MKWIAFVLAALAAALPPPAWAASLPVVAPVVDCGALQSFDPGLPGFPAHITEAQPVQVGTGKACRVRGYVSPQIKFEIQLPEQGWTQRFLQVGCGGLCGRIDVRAPQRACPMVANNEVAMATTDMGHDTEGGTWGASDPQLRVDFAYRGVHATALVAKAVIGHFYGQAPRWSYFSGCSDGGREALMEAQRYPEDFDGIAAGAAALNFLVQNSFYHGWNAHVVMPGDPGTAPTLAMADLPVLHAGALAACDAADGETDGLIADPLACRFDPHALQCKPGQTQGCLSQAAADAAAAIYDGARDDAGRKLVIAGPMPGSELGWQGVFVPGPPLGHTDLPGGPGMTAKPAAAAGGATTGPSASPGGTPTPDVSKAPLFSATIASEALRSLAFPEALPATWSLADFRFSAETLRALEAMHGLYDATDPDLSGFAARSGKLLMWHGWADPQISPANSIAYAQAVQDRAGKAAADAMLRLFVIPGMYHCGDGYGLTSIDVLTPLMAWVEDGQAPDRVVASRNTAAAEAGKGRPVFPWPALSRLRAGGDPDRAADWTESEPAQTPAKLYTDWLGAHFFASGYERACGFTGERFACTPLHPNHQ